MLKINKVKKIDFWLSILCIFLYGVVSLLMEVVNHCIIVSDLLFLFQMSILVHPDKNLEDKDRAQKSFEGKLSKSLQDWIFYSKLTCIRHARLGPNWTILAPNGTCSGL